MSHVDWDLLADHLGGALAGTPEDAQVAQLVATDAGWAQAAAQLSEALAAVTADLRTVPPPPPMPEDVTARLDAALRAAPPPAADVAPRAPVPAQPAGVVPSPSPARPGGGRPPASPSQQRRRRRARWGAGLAAAAAGVMLFAAIGLGALGLGGHLDTGDDAAEAPLAGGGDADSAQEDAEAGDGAPPADEGDRPPMIASGLDYRPESPELRSVDALPAPELGPVAPHAQPDRTTAERVEESVPSGLEPLWDDPHQCMAEIRAAHHPTTIEVQLIDFARFEDAPALVIWITTGDGVERVIVVGPACGTPAAGLDERYRVDVG